MTDVDNSQQTPGEILAAARGSRSQAQIAEKMHLSVQTIQDLENNDYQHFSAPIYISGYLRGYAKLVNVAEDVVMRAFEAMDLPTQKPLSERHVATPGVVIQTKAQPRIGLILWSTLVVILLASFLGLLWWHSRGANTNANSTTANSGTTSLMSTASNAPIKTTVVTLPANTTIIGNKAAPTTKAVTATKPTTAQHQKPTVAKKQTTTKLKPNYTISRVSN